VLRYSARIPVSGYDIIINGVPRTFHDIEHFAI
jgi:hypothetical protein